MFIEFDYWNISGIFIGIPVNKWLSFRSRVLRVCGSANCTKWLSVSGSIGENSCQTQHFVILCSRVDTRSQITKMQSTSLGKAETAYFVTFFRVNIRQNRVSF